MNSHSQKDLEYFMELAINEAKQAEYLGEVPVGAVIIAPDGQILSSAHNEKESNYNPTGHAEILALQRAGENLQNWRLTDCSMFVTLEPCPMCMGALVHSRIKHLYFGAYDPKGGALSLGFNLHQNSQLNHQFKVLGGILHFKNASLLSNFFRKRRSEYKN